MTWPNYITMGRIAGVPVLFGLILFEIWWTHWFFAALALSDLLDGWIARTFQLESEWGEMWDPIADKILVTPLLWYFWYSSVINIWIPLVITAREITVFYYRGVAKGMNERTPALFWGKVKVTFEYVGLFCLIAGELLYFWGFWALSLSLIFSALSLVQYKRHYDFLTTKKNGGDTLC